jgi:hypothetical protein
MKIGTGTAAEAQAAEVIGADGVNEAALIAMLDATEAGTVVDAGDAGSGVAATGAAVETADAGDGAAVDNAEGQEGEGDGEKSEDDGEEGTGTDKHAREKLSPEIQAVLDKRIGKEVAKRKALEDQVSAEQAAKAAAETERDELRARLETAGVKPVTGNTELFASPEALDAREAKVWDLLEFARQHSDGFDGDEKNGIPAYTAEQMREAATRYERELFREIPKAKAVLAQRAQFDAAVTAVEYPALLDPKSQDARIAEHFLRKFPALRMEPDVMVLIGDMLAGERARNAKVAAGSVKPVAVKAKTVGKTVVAAPAGQPVAGLRAEKPVDKLNMANLAKRGFSAEALAEALD